MTQSTSLIPKYFLLWMVFLACLFQVFFLEPSINFISLVVTDELLSFVGLFVTPWTVACQVPLSMEFSSQEYLSGFPFPSAGDLPNPRIKPRSPALQANPLLSELSGKPLFVFVYY